MVKKTLYCRREFVKYNEKSKYGVCIGYSEKPNPEAKYPLDIIHLCFLDSTPTNHKCKSKTRVSMTPSEAIHIGHELIGVSQLALQAKLMHLEEILTKQKS
jgi:hypothetical protein